MTAILLWLHAASTLWMVGLIWFVQIVHYPLFALVGRDQFQLYESTHQRRTTLVVGPPMLIEAMTAVLFVVAPPGDVPRWIPLIGLALVVITWLSTALLQVPCHQRLADGFDDVIARRLVRTNWIRTIAWTARVPVLIALGAAAGA